MNNLVLRENGNDDASWGLDLEVTLKNVGNVKGSEVAQVYVTYPDAGYTTPSLQLKGFGKIHNVEPGKSETLSIQLDKYAISSWHEMSHSWVAEPGTYTIHVGFSSANLVLKEEVVLAKQFFWKGL